MTEMKNNIMLFIAFFLAFSVFANKTLSGKLWADSSTYEKNTFRTPMNKPLENTILKNNYYLKNGKLMQNTNGVANVISKTQTLNNGTTVSPLGLIKPIEGNLVQLKNGDSIDLDGNIIKSNKSMAMPVSPN